MDIYSTSFNFPRLASQQSYSPASSHDADLRAGLNSSSSSPSTEVAGFDAVRKVVNSTIQAHGCQITFSKTEHNRGWTFHLTGPYAQVMAARGTILRECPLQTRASIKVARPDILDYAASSPTIKPDIRRRLDEIASQTRAHISVVNPPPSLSLPAPTEGLNGGGWSGLETERACELVVTGTIDSIDMARVRLLVMLDELSGLHAEVCEFDHKLHAIVAGRKRSAIQSIQEETATNIYLPSPLFGILGPSNGVSTGPSGLPGSPPRLQADVIWITGEFFGVQRARDMLLQVSMHQAKSVITRDIAILPRKVDWMLTERVEEIKSIMSDNATFIQFPLLGSQTSLVSVFGDHRVNIQRTIRAIMQLACQSYVASFWLLPTHFNVLMPASSINPLQIPPVLTRIASTSGAEVIYKSNCFEMHGLEHEVRAAVSMIFELDMIKPFQHEIRFQLELANEHREFISGKKNGKINKIMTMTNAKIKFENFNDSNFLIDVACNDIGAIHGLSLLQEELPAEISFHVPEAYHKRIIGVGGRSIQRIMKKYGVYVKFSNAEEFAALGGYNDNEDNVVARTPAKNAVNLDNLKQSVMELVNPKDKDYMLETVSIPRKFHRTLLGEKSIFIHDIETKTNSHIRFPDKETGLDVVTIFGPESQVNIAAAMLLDHVPFEADMAVPAQPDLARLCQSADFLAFVEGVKHDYQISIDAHIKSGNQESSFKFRCQRSNSDFLSAAKEMLESYLLNNNIRVYPTHAHKRSDSFADAFPHFNSKLLSTAKTGSESPDMGRTSEAFAERRVRLASSTPDVKALFNSPSYVYQLPEHDEHDAASYQNQSNYVLPFPTHDLWNPNPMPPMRSTVPTQQSRVMEDAFKRGSDSRLEAKLKQQKGSITNRAQSLDLTFSLSRITESSQYRSGSPSNESPTDTASPTSATVPSFPSVYAPSPMANSTPTISNNNRSRPARLDSQGAEEITRVISNINLST